MRDVRASVVLLSVGLVACSAGAQPTPRSSTHDLSPMPIATPPPSASPAPSPLVFESERHRYRLDVPSGWQVVQYEGEWTSFDEFGPGVEVPGEDVIAPPDLSSFLVANSMAIPKGMSSAEWLARFHVLVTSGLERECPGTQRRGRLGAEPAAVLEQTCDGSVIVGRSLTHARRGYYFTIRFPEGDSTAEATLEALIASIRFIAA